MRKSFVATGLMLVALTLTNCQKEQNETSAPASEPNFELFAQPVSTKTANDGLDTKWVAGDGINVFHAVAGSTTYVSDGQFTVKDTESGRFDGTISKTLSAAAYDWYAFYPYSEYITTPNNTKAGWCYIGSRTDASQAQTGDNNMSHICGSNYPLYGIAKEVKASDVPSIQMQHLTSVIKVIVTNSTEEELSLNSVSFTADENISGQFYIAFNGEAPTYTPASYPSKTASLTVSGVKVAANANATVYMAIKPFTAKSGSTLKLAVNGYEKTITLKNDITFTAGHIKPLNFNYDKVQEKELYTLCEEDNVFEDGGKYVFAIKDGKDGTYYFVTNGGSSNNLSRASLTVSENVIDTPDSKYVFTATKKDAGYELKNSLSNYIYCSGGNTTLNTNSTTSSVWVPTFLSSSKSYKLQVSSNSGRYISYGNNATALKAYANSNFKNQITSAEAVGQYAGAISVFKYNYEPSSQTSIVCDNASELSARASTLVELPYTINNPVEGTALSIACDGEIVTEAIANETSVLFSVSANKTAQARTGKITLTYGTLIKDVLVSQLAPVFKVSRTTVELEATADASTTITLTSDFDWMADASTDAAFSFTPDSYIWTEGGSQKVTISATAANESENGTIDLGVLTFLNMETNETIEVKVAQKSSYVVPTTGTTVTKKISDIVSENNYKVSSGNTINTIQKSLKIDDVITLSSTGGGNTGSFWGTSPNIDWRCYQNGSSSVVKISSVDGYLIEKVKLIFTVSNSGTLNGGDVVSGTEYIVNAQDISYTIGHSSGSKNGQIKITEISVAYKEK